MSERPPLDPWGGSVNYLVATNQCPQYVAEGIVVSTAAALGIGVQLLANETDEDRRFINALMGIYKTPEEEALERQEREANGDVLTAVHIDLPPSIPFLARLPLEGGVDTGTINYELYAEKLNSLHCIAGELIRRLN